MGHSNYSATLIVNSKGLNPSLPERDPKLRTLKQQLFVASRPTHLVQPLS